MRETPADGCLPSGLPPQPVCRQHLEICDTALLPGASASWCPEPGPARPTAFASRESSNWSGARARA
eukprot:6029339-Lingulodinium_polyedra.AAC.1